MKFLALVIGFSLLAVVAAENEEEPYCYSHDPEKYFNFATKTSYEVARGDVSALQKPQGCVPVRFWSLNRHGARLPKKRGLSRMMSLEDGLLRKIFENNAAQQLSRDVATQRRLCEEDLELLGSWSLKIDPNMEPEALTMNGYEEAKSLAMRYKQAFPSLFPSDYNSSDYYFQHTNTSRTKGTFRGYAEGLFGKYNRAIANVSDAVIREFEHCAGWQSKIKQIDTWFHNREFKKTAEFRRMIEEVSERLGFQEALNDTMVLDAYDMCRFEKAWDVNKTSPWCSIFTKEQLEVLEYYEDVTYYYYSGYGIDFNPEVGCAPIKDLYENFERAIEDSSRGPKVSVHFSHSVPIMMAYTSLGLFRDEPLLAYDNYAIQKDRKFRLSKMDTFANNIAVVLYSCEDQAEEHMVHFLINERPVDFDGCPRGLCPWSTLQENLKTVAEGCDLRLCEKTTKNQPKTSNSGYLKQTNAALTLVVVVGRLIYHYYYRNNQNGGL